MCEYALAKKLVIPLGADAGVPTLVEPSNNGGHWPGNHIALCV
jgi:hypothetical protein